MKEFTEQKVDDIIKLKFGKLVDVPGHTSFVSNRVLAKIFKCSTSMIRRLYMERFEKNRNKNRPLLE